MESFTFASILVGLGLVSLIKQHRDKLKEKDQDQDQVKDRDKHHGKD